MSDVKLIALDLDGTLLRSDKSLSERNREALRCAAEKNVLVVPCTGRYYLAMPEAVRTLPFVRYVIVINGAGIMDVENDRVLCEELIPHAQALEIMEYLDTLPVAYDCYQGKGGFMTKSMQDSIEDYLDKTRVIEMVRKLRQPVPDLKEWLRASGQDVQKIQLFTKDPDLRRWLLDNLSKRFDSVSISSSNSQNVEINSVLANKGTALLKLAETLGIPRECTMAFGDGLNDINMMDAAGTAVVMENATDEVKAHAGLIAPTNDEDGVAKVIEKLILGRTDGTV